MKRCYGTKVLLSDYAKINWNKSNKIFFEGMVLTEVNKIRQGHFFSISLCVQNHNLDENSPFRQNMPSKMIKLCLFQFIFSQK